MNFNIYGVYIVAINFTLKKLVPVLRKYDECIFANKRTNSSIKYHFIQHVLATNIIYNIHYDIEKDSICVKKQINICFNSVMEEFFMYNEINFFYNIVNIYFI